MGYVSCKENKTLNFKPIKLSELEEILRMTVDETSRDLKLEILSSKYYDQKSVEITSILVNGCICQCNNGRMVTLLSTSSQHDNKKGNVFTDLKFMFPFKCRKYDHDLYDEEIESICKNFNKNYKIVAE